MIVGQYKNIELDDFIHKRDELVAQFCAKFSIPLEDFILFDYQLQLITNQSACFELKQLIDSCSALKRLGGE